MVVAQPAVSQSPPLQTHEEVSACLKFFEASMLEAKANDDQKQCLLQGMDILTSSVLKVTGFLSLPTSMSK